MGLSAPVNLTWEVSLACNLRCSHCLSSSGEPAAGELTTAEALNLVDQLHTAGVFQINFGGGEPFLRPDFEEILAACHGKGIMTCISTNGTLLNAERVARLATSRLVARRATRSALSRVPLVEMQVMIPFPWQAARISSKSGRRNGSPPPKLIWNTPA